MTDRGAESGAPTRWLARAVILFFCASPLRAQGAAPETAPTLFPGGGLISTSSIFTSRASLAERTAIAATARPRLANDTALHFTWGFYPNLDITVVLPIITNRIESTGAPDRGGTGIGDAMFLLKYRFYRRDSRRGTTQASVTLGPKVPSGRTDLRGTDGKVLPAGLQPGSGSTDLFVGANWTYTGLFNVKRLVADEDFHSLVRSKGTQATRLGSEFESRFWISYRPYEAKDGSREWFIGPDITWLHAQDDRVAGVNQSGSGGDAALLGMITYVGVRPGMHIWLGVDWDIGHSNGERFMAVHRSISFGITQQFRMHVLR